MEVLSVYYPVTSELILENFYVPVGRQNAQQLLGQHVKVAMVLQSFRKKISDLDLFFLYFFLNVCLSNIEGFELPHRQKIKLCDSWKITQVN